MFTGVTLSAFTPFRLLGACRYRLDGWTAACAASVLVEHIQHRCGCDFTAQHAPPACAH